MKQIRPLMLALALPLAAMACGEAPTEEQALTGEQAPAEYETVQQALDMDLRLNWHDNDTIQITFDFPSPQPGNGVYRICVRPVGGSWVCEKHEPANDGFGCNLAGECTAVYFANAEGVCGDVQEVRVQEGRAPFYREVEKETIEPCALGGSFWGASGGYKAGCHVQPTAPSGTTGFTYANHFYHTPDSSGGCPLPGSTFDGLNCQVMPIPRNQGFVRWPGYFLYRPFNCPAP